MYFEFNKHTIWINSNGAQKDNEKVVMFHRLLVQNGLDDGSFLETNKNGKGIALTVCDYSTIEELKEYVKDVKELVKSEKLSPTSEDIKEARQCEYQMDLEYHCNLYIETVLN